MKGCRVRRTGVIVAGERADDADHRLGRTRYDRRHRAHGGEHPVDVDKASGCWQTPRTTQYRSSFPLRSKTTGIDTIIPPASCSMQLGVIGLGRMGRIVVDRVQKADHTVVAFDVESAAVDDVVRDGVQGATSIEDFLETLDEPKRIWLMVPAGQAVDETLATLAPALAGDDIVIDGGNSHFEASIDRAERIEAAYLDCGTSGGPAGADLGFSLMVGGPLWAYDACRPIFDAVATGPDGHALLGPSGAGHYVKMVHNGIEYAMMQTYGEGFELLHEGRYDLDLEAVARTWNNGAVIRSWLLELCEDSFREEGSDLGDVADYVAGGSTGTWTVEEALSQEVPVPLLYQAVAERFGSRRDRFSRRLANRLRYGFGRHDVERR